MSDVPALAHVLAALTPSGVGEHSVG